MIVYPRFVDARTPEERRDAYRRVIDRSVRPILREPEPEEKQGDDRSE